MLDAQIGPGGEADRLLVYSTATLGETGGTLRITIDDAARAGQYVLLHATEGRRRPNASITPIPTCSTSSTSKPC